MAVEQSLDAIAAEAEARVSRGGELLDGGEVLAAISQFQEAAILYAQAAERDRNDLAWPYKEAMARDRLADALVLANLHDDALLAYERGDHLRDEIMKHEGDDPNILEAIATSRVKQAGLFLHRGDLDAAKGLLRRALELFLSLAKSRSRATEVFGLTTALEVLADALARRNRMSEAVDASIDCLAAEHKRDVSADPALLLARARLYRSVVESRPGNDVDDDSALATLRRAIGLVDRASKLHPPVPQWYREATLAYESIGRILERQGDASGAAREYAAGLAFAEQLVRADPRSHVLQADVTILKTRIAALDGAQQAASDARDADKGIGTKPDSTLKVFLAAGGRDLVDDQMAVADALRAHGGFEVVSHDPLGRSEMPLVEYTREKMSKADAVVVVVDPARMRPRTLVDTEYDLARQLAKPILVFAAQDVAEWGREFLRRYDGIVQRYQDPLDLRARVIGALELLRVDHDPGRSGSPDPNTNPGARPASMPSPRDAGIQVPVARLLYDGVPLSDAQGIVVSTEDLGFGLPVSECLIAPRSAFGAHLDARSVEYTTQPLVGTAGPSTRVGRILWQSPPELSDAVIFELAAESSPTVRFAAAFAEFDYDAPVSARPRLIAFSRDIFGGIERTSLQLEGAVAVKAARAPEVVELRADSLVPAGAALCVDSETRVVGVVRSTRPDGFRPRDPPAQLATSMTSMRDAIVRTFSIYNHARDWSGSGQGAAPIVSRRRLRAIEAQLAAEPPEPWVLAVVVPFVAAIRARHARSARRIYLAAAILLALVPLGLAMLAHAYVRTATRELSAPAVAIAGGGGSAHLGAIADIAVTDDGRLAATVGSDNVVRLWALDSGRIRWESKLPRPAVGVAFRRTPQGGVDAVWVRSEADEPLPLLDIDRGEPLAPGRDVRLDFEHVHAVPLRTSRSVGRTMSAFAGPSALIATASGHVAFDLSPDDVGGPPAHREPVAAAVMSRDGARAATAATNGEVLVWSWSPRDNGTGPDWKSTPVGSALSPNVNDSIAILLHDSPIAGIAYAHSGQRILTVSEDRLVRIWDARRGREVARLAGHADRITAADFNADDSRIVTASHDGTARLWDGATGREIAVLRGHQGPVLAATFSPDGRRLATAGADGQIALWDVTTGAQTATITASHAQALNAVRFSSDGRRLLAGGADMVARIWNAESGVLESRFVHPAVIGDVRFSADGSRIAIVALDGSASLRETASERVVKSFAAAAVAFSPDGRKLAVSSSDGGVSLLAADTGEVLADFRGKAAGRTPSLSFSPDGRYLATTDEGLRLLDGATLRSRQFLLGEFDIDIARVSPDGQRVAIADANRVVIFTAIGSACNGPCTSVTFSADRRWLLSAGLFGTIGLSEVANPTAVPAWVTGFAPVNVVRFRGRTTEFVSGGDDAIARLWTYDPAVAPSGRIRHRATIRGHAAAITHAEISGDGRVLVTGDIQGGLRVTDLDRAVSLSPLDRWIVAETLGAWSLARTVAEGVERFRIWIAVHGG